MQEINNWENVQASSDFENLPVGAYVFKIVSVVDSISKSGTPFLDIKCDVAEGEFKGIASNNEKALRRMRAFYNTPKTNGMFKRFLEAVTQCNRGFKWRWHEQDLVGKVFCAVLIGHEYVNNYNGVSIGTEINYPSTMDLDKFKKGDYKIPPIKKLDPSELPIQNATVENNEVADDGLPF